MACPTPPPSTPGSTRIEQPTFSTAPPLSPSFGRLGRPTVQPLKWAANPCTGPPAYYNAQSHWSISHCVLSVHTHACVCVLRHVSVCLSASCITQSTHEKVKIIVAHVLCDLGNSYISPLQHFLRTQPIAIAGRRFHFSPTSVWAPLSPFHWSKVITGAYESETNESLRGRMGGHGLGASGEWGRINSSPGTDGAPLTSSLSLYPNHVHQILAAPQKASAKVRGGNNFLKWWSQTAISTTFECTSVRLPEIIGKLICRARGECPPFKRTPDLCNCKDKPLFESVNINIMSCYETRRADSLVL